MFGGDRRRMARRHMSRVLGPRGDLDRAHQRIFKSYGRYWAETLWVRPRRIPDFDATLRSSVSSICTKAATEAREQSSPSHMSATGNRRLCRVSEPALRSLAVAESLRNRTADQMVSSLRNQFGITIVLAGRAADEKAAQAVAAGAAVALLCDRDLAAGESSRVLR